MNEQDQSRGKCLIYRPSFSLVLKVIGLTMFLLLFTCNDDTQPENNPFEPANKPVETVKVKDALKSENDLEKPVDKEETKVELGVALDKELVYSYNPVGKRDPFLPPEKKNLTAEEIVEKPSVLSPLQNFSIEELSVTGIVWGIPNPKAIIQTPEGGGYVVEEGSLVGKNWGKVTFISEERLLIEEEFRDSKGVLHKETKEIAIKVAQGKEKRL